MFMCALCNAHSFYVQQCMFFSGLNVLFHKCNEWQGYRMKKNIIIHIVSRISFRSFVLMQKFYLWVLSKNDDF